MRSQAGSNGHSHSQSGLTLAEIVVSVLILVPVMVLVLTVFMTSVRSVTDSWDTTKSTAIAQRLIDKIRSMRWDENTPAGGGPISLSSASALLGPDGGEPAPADFDDVDDWDNFNLPDPLPANVRYGRQVNVAYVNLSSSGMMTPSSTPTDYKKVDVRVTNGAGKVTTFSLLLTNI